VQPEERVTIVDVAARAGVHPGTVSRALSHPERVAPATRERVEAAVRDLGFIPNRAARGLITGRSGNVAVIVPDITNPHFASLVRSVERAARGADMQVLLVDTGEQPDEELRAARTLAREVDGFVAVSPRRLHRDLNALGGKPAVFVNRPVDGHGSVLLRTAPAMAEALRHLASLGHSTLAYLEGPKGSWAASERQSAVKRTARVIGLRVVAFSVAAPTFEAANGLVPELAAAGVSAVVGFNDLMALGVLAGLSRMGIAVPEQMSVFGCDDVAMASMVDPSLSTIHLPSEEAGTTAVRLLHEEPSTVELPGALVLRESTGRFAGRRASAV
jgi:LacI family transcriptional regulator, galactose operon repressor